MQFVVNSGDSRAPRRKVKTGCSTCRTRKVKCDEGRPSCQRCVSTGRTCDGYASPFRVWEADKKVKNESHNGAHGAVKPYLPGSGSGTHAAEADLLSFETMGPITANDIAQLQRCFSTKTLFPTVALACDDEARQVLQASKTDPAVRHAVTSLRALRADLEAAAQASGHGPSSSSTPNHLSQVASSYAAGTSPTPSHDYGLQQYCMALGGLASNLSQAAPTPAYREGPSIRSALLCCQVFISIEQVRGHFAAMAQHIVQGLRILYEHREKSEKTKTCGDNLPALDIFVIKLFAAPCKFADMHRGSGPSSSASTPASTHRGDTRTYRPLAADVRTELTRLALATVTFVGSIKAGAPPASLLSTKQYLLRSLAKWHASFEREQLAVTSAEGQPELLSVLFLRFFHQVLRVVLIGSLDDGTGNSSDESDGDGRSSRKTRSEVIDAEYKQLQSIASTVGDRVKAEGRKAGEW